MNAISGMEYIGMLFKLLKEPTKSNTFVESRLNCRQLMIFCPSIFFCARLFGAAAFCTSLDILLPSANLASSSAFTFLPEESLLLLKYADNWIEVIALSSVRYIWFLGIDLSIMKESQI